MGYLTPRSQYQIIDASAVRITAPADLVFNVLASVLVPGNLMGPNGILRITTCWTVVNNANGKALRVSYGTAATDFMIVNAINAVSLHHQVQIANRGLTNSQVASQGQANSFTINASAPITSAEDTTLDQTIQFRAQKAVALDDIFLEYFLVELLRP